MPDDAPPTQPPDSPDRRALSRYSGKASVSIIRESDRMRTGLDGQLRDISIAGIGVQMATPLPVGEAVKITLANPVQRVKKETRGIVRHVTPMGNDSFHVGIELLARLTPLELSLLKMGLPLGEGGAGSVWV